MAPPPSDTWEDICVDDDHDGYGFQCEKGDDCDDADETIFKGCLACAKPNAGCECPADSEPVDCTLPKELSADGTLLCKSGTRYCRDGKWSECEGIKTFAAPPPSKLLTSSLIDPDGGLVICSSCSPDCYQVVETPNADGSVGGDAGIVPGPTGGITISSRVVGGGDGGSGGDGGGSGGDGGLLDDTTCIPGTAPDFDCDGVPDAFDPLPTAPPFSSDHDTIFMDLGPGDTQEETFEIRFYLNTADIYFYLDMTGSMNEEKNNLIASLRDGNYMTDGGAGVECADRNFNGSTTDEEYLKNEGIAGNLACMIRDSRLGTGWHRDLPFPRADSEGFAFGPHDFEAFQHEQDITGDVDAVLTSLNRFATRGGINRPEGGIVGLYALATGSEVYMGWDRPGNPARRDCPAGTWGYPCFRDDAVPIVIWMTDAPITNGPAPAEDRFEITNQGNQNGWTRAQPVNWITPASLAIETGSDGAYNQVPNTNETFATAFDIGDVNNSFKTYTGNTTAMVSNINYAALTGTSGTTYAPVSSVCGSGSAWSASVQTAPDAVFKMRVTQAEPITVSTRGSRVQTALAIVDAKRIDGTVTAGTPTAAGNALPTTAYNLNTLTFPTSVNLYGSTSGASAQFSRDSLGCLASGTGSSDKIGAVVVKFNLANDVSSLRVVSDSGYALATTAFAARPGVMTVADTSLSSITAQIGASTTRTGNSNDEINSYSLGNMTGVYRRFTNGDTSDGDLSGDYSTAIFNGVSNGSAVTCTGASGSARDAVFNFSLSAATRLRIEGAGNNSTLQAGFDHMIGLVRRNMVPHAGLTANVTDATAQTIQLSELTSGEYDWLQYNGTLGGVANTYLQSEVGPVVATTSATDCTNNSAAASSALQGVFVLDVPTTQSYDFDTAGSTATTWLSLHQGTADTQRLVTSTNPNNGSSTTTTPTAAMALGALDETSLLITGSLQTHGTSATDYVPSATVMGCGTTYNSNDAVYSFTVAATQTLQVSTGASTGSIAAQGAPGFNSYVEVFAGSVTAANRVAGNCTDQTGGTGNNAYVTGTFTANPGITYYVVVKSFTTGSLSSTTGPYSLWLRDTTFNHFMECDYGSQLHVASARAAKISKTLIPGRYYLVVKGTSGAYQLNVRRTPTAEPTLMACDRNSGGAQHSIIEQDLPAGNYAVIVRGYSDAANGTYNLIFRDMGIAPAPIGCAYDANGSVPTALTLNNLAARDGSDNLIDYYLVMRGNTSTSGNYSIRIEDPSYASTMCAYDNVTMSYTQTTPVAYTYNTDINNAEWTGTLPVGDYYVVLKGYDGTDTVSSGEDNDKGFYQLTVGDQANFEGTGTFGAQRWLGTDGDGRDGVRKALLDRQIRVIMVDSTQGSGDDATYSDQQGRIISQATGAVALDGTPLFFKINDDGTGLGTAIVDSVNQLAGNLAMDVSVRLVESPDSPSPKRFNFRAEAIDTVGDLCQPPVDTDNDPEHIPDTHVHCTPGAVPRFKVTLSNPAAPNNVPPNSRDPQGGYNMRLDLIGDGQFVVDQIPIYIIPEDVIEQPGDSRYDPTATYEETMTTPGCSGNEAPLWNFLWWDAELPSGTAITWSVCTGNTEAELAACALQPLVTVQSGNACLSDTNCPSGTGYCNKTRNVCELVTGPTCSRDSECGVSGVCTSGRCSWTTNEIDVKPVLTQSGQGKKWARVQAVLASNTLQTYAPTVHAWRLKYTCTAQE